MSSIPQKLNPKNIHQGNLSEINGYAKFIYEILKL